MAANFAKDIYEFSFIQSLKRYSQIYARRKITMYCFICSHLAYTGVTSCSKKYCHFFLKKWVMQCKQKDSPHHNSHIQPGGRGLALAGQLRTGA